MAKTKQVAIVTEKQSQPKKPFFGACGYCTKHKKEVLDWQKYCWGKRDKNGSLYDTKKLCGDCIHYSGSYQTHEDIKGSEKVQYCMKCKHFKSFFGDTISKVVCMDAVYFERNIYECDKIPINQRFEDLDYQDCDT